MNYSLIRQRAREQLKGKWVMAVILAAVAALLGGLVAGSSFLPSLEGRIDPEMINDYDRLVKVLRSSASTGTLGLVAFLIGGPLQLGYAKSLLKQWRGEKPEFNDLFTEFGRFGTGFVQKFLRLLYWFLWSLLLVVPGIIARYSYAMTPFLLVDYPELTASEAIARSKDLMNGHKWELFVLRLSFIGWDILCLLTANLGYLLLNPYINAAYAEFYRQILEMRRSEVVA